MKQMSHEQGDQEKVDSVQTSGLPNGRLDNGYTSDLSVENIDLSIENFELASEIEHFDSVSMNSLRNAKGSAKWKKDFSKPPKDEALVHRPSDYGEITEETV